MAAENQATTTRKRQRKRRRRQASLDLSASSDSESSSDSGSGSDSKIQEKTTKANGKQKESSESSSSSNDSSSDSDSSAVFSSSDEETTTRRGKRKSKQQQQQQESNDNVNMDDPSTTVTKHGDTSSKSNGFDLPPDQQVPQRPSTPPYLFWKKAKEDAPDMILEDDLPPAEAEPTSDELRFRDFYMSKLVEQFAPQLDGLRKEPDFSQSKLSNLISSLASGANTFDSQSRQIVLDTLNMQQQQSSSSS